MAATKRRQKGGQKRDELELAIAKVLKASPIQKAKYRRAFTYLHLRLQREQAETALQTTSLLARDSNQLGAVSHGNTQYPASSPGSTGGQLNDLPSDGSEESEAREGESTIDLCLKLAREETEIAGFFQEGGHLSCVEQVSTGEDRRVQDFAECEGRGQAEHHTGFRKLLAILSLATEYEAWEVVQLNANRKLTEVAVSVFVREHPDQFPDHETAKRAIYAGRRHKEQDRKFPGTSAVMAFAPREFDRAGPLEQLNKQFELDELKFIPHLGLRIVPYLEQAQQAYKQQLGLDVLPAGRAREANNTAASVGEVQIDSAAAQVAASQEVMMHLDLMAGAQVGK
jgi:hypothetical protein